jgi:hypothetical protein
MWRTKAVTSMLVEDVAELQIVESPDATSAKKGESERDERPEMEALLRARRKAILVCIVDWIAILVLLAFHSGSGSFLPLEPSIDTVFTLGVLAVAMHSGFRLGQGRTYQAVSRVCQELWERESD